SYPHTNSPLKGQRQYHHLLKTTPFHFSLQPTIINNKITANVNCLSQHSDSLIFVFITIL
ncbi:MAG TPA: hypothetical protein PKX37_07830, partial [Flexilinea sp.]|nr:hypothetical protein [Flexilinea sp.]